MVGDATGADRSDPRSGTPGQGARHPGPLDLPYDVVGHVLGERAGAPCSPGPGERALPPLPGIPRLFQALHTAPRSGYLASGPRGTLCDPRTSHDTRGRAKPKGAPHRGTRRRGRRSSGDPPGRPPRPCEARPGRDYRMVFGTRTTSSPLRAPGGTDTSGNTTGCSAGRDFAILTPGSPPISRTAIHRARTGREHPGEGRTPAARRRLPATATTRNRTAVRSLAA